MTRRLATGRKLALLGAAGVLSVMLVAMFAFNLFESWQLQREATSALDEALGWEPNDPLPSSRRVNYLAFYNDFSPVEYASLSSDGHAEYSETDEELLAWCYKNMEYSGEVRFAQLSSASCYVEINEASALNAPGDYLLAYIDVTLQLGIVNNVNLLFVVIALVGGALAAFAGWRAARRIDEAETARTRFYENMSHELKTPLAAIRGYAEGTAQGVVDSEVANRAILRETDRMTNLVQQVLDLSKIEAGAIELHRETVPMDDFVQDCLMPFEGIARTRGLDVRLDLAEGEEDLDADVFGHAVENVLSNAMRHAEHTVVVRYAKGLLVVENDGTMPAPDEVDALFERFHTGEGGSTGIGLALAREICELHGFSLRAEVDGGMLRMVFGLR